MNNKYFRTIILVFTILLLLCIVYIPSYNIDNSKISSIESQTNKINVDSNEIYKDSDRITTNDNLYKDIKDIKIDDELFNQYVDIITRYSLAYEEKEKKAIMIYMASFSVFNLNFVNKRLEKLNNKFVKVGLQKDIVNYPRWSKYHNLQVVIANAVNTYIVNGERVLTNSFDTDRQIIYGYLWKLFYILDVMS